MSFLSIIRASSLEGQKRNKRESGGIPKREVCGAYNFYKMFQSISWWGNAEHT